MRTLRRVLIGVALVLFALFCAGFGRMLAGTRAPEQPWRPTHIEMIGRADSIARTTWSRKLYQKERGYCASWTLRGDTVAVFDLEPAVDTSGVSWDTITFSCEPPTVAFHTHPPQDCNPTGTYCAYSTWRAQRCNGSLTDQVGALQDGVLFEFVQCDSDVVAAYFAPQPVPPIQGRSGT